MSLAPVQFREADAADAAAIAALHAASWRRHYRGIYSDGFLDSHVTADREQVWAHRLTHLREGRQTVIAEDKGSAVAFVHTVFDEDPKWGSLLDNLHVALEYKRRGIGAQLLGLSAEAAAQRGTGLYLWVNERNVEAQAFYRAHGGSLVERVPSEPPGGKRDRLAGQPIKLRCVWAHRALPVPG